MKKTKKTIRAGTPKYAYHGYQEWYIDRQETKLWYRCNMVRNVMIAYAEHHRIKQCIYHIRWT